MAETLAADLLGLGASTDLQRRKICLLPGPTQAAKVAHQVPGEVVQQPVCVEA